MQTTVNRFIGAIIKLSGRVQGVGFRPFVYRLAKKYGINGYVLNNMEGVEISAEGEENNLLNFIKSLDSDSEKPPLAAINNKTVDFTELKQFFYESFEIKESDKTGDNKHNVKSGKLNKLNLTIPPDIAICGKCLEELFNPSDRRYLYPFINCTDCGPRFTISKELPYDRVSTSMDKFKMCQECQAEYKNPLSRRFHAEPDGCFVCGPEIKFVPNSHISNMSGNIGKINSKINNRINSLAHDDSIEGSGVINESLELKRLKSLNAVKSLVDIIKNGGIGCVKGIGGFHLMADAANDDALKLLRERKNRPKKPFAAMLKNMEQVLKYAQADNVSAGLLTAKERPICLLKYKGNLSYYVNCGLKDIGVFLPYAPLHYVIFSLFDGPLVATSANIGGEPIVKDNEEAFLKLNGIADGFLIHNRDILKRCDDSVVKAAAVTGEGGASGGGDNPADSGRIGGYFFIRRSRGYVTEPFKLPFNLKRNVLAAGAFLKNTFAIAYAGGDGFGENIRDKKTRFDLTDGYENGDNGGYSAYNINTGDGNKSGAVILSQHNGDLDNMAALDNFKENIEDFEKFYNFKPEIIVYDSHPAYENTKWAKESAKERNIRGIAIQHHRAHIISCMAENGLGLNEEIFGIAFDGTGYGDDGTIWGGEFFSGNYKNLKRTGSFKKFRLIGGDKAVKSPKRILLSILFGILSGDDVSVSRNHSYNGIKSAGIFNLISGLTGFSEKETSVFLKMWKNGLNSPFASSCGRIFDAVSCLCGFNGDITYEGEAAVYLENLCSEYENKSSCGQVNLISKKDCFDYGIQYVRYEDEDVEDFFTVDYNPVFNDIIQIILDNCGLKTGFNSLRNLQQALRGKSETGKYAGIGIKGETCGIYENIAGKFINTLAMIISDTALKAGCKNVCMSGGVFQNALLRNKICAVLNKNGFNAYFNEKIPTNDGGISFGQAVYGGIID